MQIEQIAAHRIGGELAVAHKIRPIPVARLDGVLLEGGDEV
jgi:hypothetical protein